MPYSGVVPLKIIFLNLFSVEHIIYVAKSNFILHCINVSMYKILPNVTFTILNFILLLLILGILYFLLVNLLFNLLYLSIRQFVGKCEFLGCYSRKTADFFVEIAYTF